MYATRQTRLDSLPKLRTSAHLHRLEHLSIDHLAGRVTGIHGHIRQFMIAYLWTAP